MSSIEIDCQIVKSKLDSSGELLLLDCREQREWDHVHIDGATLLPMSEIQNRVSEVFSVDIHPAADVGRGVFIDHATGVVIGETAVVGDDVTILHGVTLGGTGKDSGDRHPKVGRGVFIGANAQLLGNIVVGEDSRIGASSVVLKSVDAHSTVAGIPARVVRRDDRPTIPLTTPEAARA